MVIKCFILTNKNFKTKLFLPNYNHPKQPQHSCLHIFKQMLMKILLEFNFYIRSLSLTLKKITRRTTTSERNKFLQVIASLRWKASESKQHKAINKQHITCSKANIASDRQSWINLGMKQFILFIPSLKKLQLMRIKNSLFLFYLVFRL